MKEEEPLKRIKLPNRIYGIDFCINNPLRNVIRELHNRKVSCKCWDYDGKPVHCKMGKRESELMARVESFVFIGSGLDTSKILSVNYADIFPYKSFILTIKFKEEYFNSLFESLKERFGYQNVNKNRNNYGEISWYSDKENDYCIEDITLSKRLQWDENPENGVCFLVISSKAREAHAH
ncbi:MAG TPA: hypothetical protein PKN50_18255 [Spirochaetota bacterium]|nr:hypothetical protein [Spirochaetota bacterium]